MMILLLRVFLIGLIIYLLTRSFARFWAGEKQNEKNDHSRNENGESKKKVSKEIGEYVDYEDVE